MQRVSQDQLPRCLKGFEHINRYWDRMNDSFAAKILPGEYYVTVEDELIVTVLGSCVSACIRDKVFGIGGMNHFMLPASSADKLASIGEVTESTRYGNYAMEKMINDILKNGGHRKNLEVKLCGGGRVLKNMQTIDIGARNIEFVQEYVHTEGLNVLAEDLGDLYPRKVIFNPKTGKMRIKKLRSMHNRTIVDREENYMKELKVEPIQGDIELF